MFLFAFFLAPDVDPTAGGVTTLTPEQQQALVGFVLEHKWFPLLAFIAHQGVRLLKSDTKLPLDLPPRTRAIAAVALGFTAGVADAIVTQIAKSEPLTAYIIGRAVLEGLTAGGTAIAFQALYVDGAKGGKETWLPRAWLKPGFSPGSGKPPSIPPEKMTQQEKADALVELKAIPKPTAEEQKLIDSFTVDLKPTSDADLPLVLHPASSMRTVVVNPASRDVPGKDEKK